MDNFNNKYVELEFVKQKKNCLQNYGIEFLS